MTVYIVTSGDYSAYSIEAVFQNKESAEKYIKYNKNSSYNWQIEEFQTKDKDYLNPEIVTQVDIECKFDKNYEVVVSSIKTYPIIKSNALSRVDYFKRYTTLDEFYIHRAYAGFKSESQLYKIAYDTGAEIKDLIRLGFNFDQINEILNSRDSLELEENNYDNR